ncbi:hypothetical protein AMQ68_15890 [Chryseobacterium sp. ERMR1:04]|nr:hypothetical protein AMQ68_15890 [Chryseobacterium sp. ERMR1:04]
MKCLCFSLKHNSLKKTFSSFAINKKFNRKRSKSYLNIISLKDQSSQKNNISTPLNMQRFLKTYVFLLAA